jgi:hypothetical protein
MWALMNVDITMQAAEVQGGNKEKASCTVNPALFAYVINQQGNYSELCCQQSLLGWDIQLIWGITKCCHVMEPGYRQDSDWQPNVLCSLAQPVTALYRLGTGTGTTVRRSIRLNSGDGFQRRPFSFLWAPKLSPSLSKLKLSYNRRSVGQTVLVSGHHLGPATIWDRPPNFTSLPWKLY